MPVYTPRDRVDDILFDMTHHILRSNVDEHGHSCIEIVLSFPEPPFSFSSRNAPTCIRAA